MDKKTTEDPFAAVREIAENPELIDEFTSDQLEEARRQTAEYANALTEHIDESDDVDGDIKALEAANELDQRLETRMAELAEADEQRKAKLAELSERFAPKPQEPEVVPEEETPEAEEEEPEKVTASAEPKLAAIAKRQPKVSKPDLTDSLVASADGAPITSTADLGRRVIAAFEQGKSKKGGGRELFSVATFSTKHPYTATDSPSDNFAELQRMRRDLAASNSLTAAGFTAPAQPVYDFFSISTEEGLVNLPTFNAPRGRVTFPGSLSFDTLYASQAISDAIGGATYTATDDENGVSKTVYTPDAPSTTTCSVSARPKIVKFSNFDQLFNPEFVAHVEGETMRAHSHLVNEDHMIALVALATAVGGGNPGGGTLVNVSQVVGFEAKRYRDKYRMGLNAPLDLIAPAWLEDALIADMIARIATLDYGNAKARVNAIWANMGVRVQYIYDWQSLLGFGGFPATVDLLFYAPGTFVRLDGGSIDLGVVRDSTLNLTNDFETFMETFEGVCMPGHEAILINDLTVCPTGDASDGGTITCAVGS